MATATERMDGANAVPNDDQEITLTGRIRIGDAGGGTSCIVRTMDDTSATLYLFGASRVPDLFQLTITAHNINVECQVVERFGKTLKVTFGASHFVEREKQRMAARLASVAAGREPEDADLSRLWIVEDDLDDRLLIQEAFLDANVHCELSFFEDGAAFLEHLDAHDALDNQDRPTLVMMDINMPRLDGVTTLAKLRDRPGYRHLPVLMFTTSQREEDIRRTYALGVGAYITKPSDDQGFARVVAFVRNWFGPQVLLPAL